MPAGGARQRQQQHDSSSERATTKIGLTLLTWFFLTLFQTRFCFKITSISPFFEAAEIQEDVAGFIVLVLWYFRQILPCFWAIRSIYLPSVQLASYPQDAQAGRPWTANADCCPAVPIQSESRGQYEMFCVTCTWRDRWSVLARPSLSQHGSTQTCLQEGWKHPRAPRHQWGPFFCPLSPLNFNTQKPKWEPILGLCAGSCSPFHVARLAGWGEWKRLIM